MQKAKWIIYDEQESQKTVRQITDSKTKSKVSGLFC